MRNCNRIFRIANEIQKNIAVILQCKVRDPRVVGMVTILRIDLSKDLSCARIFVTFFDIVLKEQLDEKIKILRGASGFIRKLLAKSMSLRIVPELFFFYDDSVHKSMKVYHLLSKLSLYKK